MMFSNFWADMKNEQKSKHKVIIKIIVKGEHVEHTIYLFYHKSQGL